MTWCHVPADATRVEQGVVTAIGFPGAGVIMRDGPGNSGLTAAASVWAASATPGRSTLEVSVTFGPAGPLTFEDLGRLAQAQGYLVLRDSLRIIFTDIKPVWRFCVVALNRARVASSALLAQELAKSDGVASFSTVPLPP